MVLNSPIESNDRTHKHIGQVNLNSLWLSGWAAQQLLAERLSS
jgi:hypothetical protein